MNFAEITHLCLESRQSNLQPSCDPIIKRCAGAEGGFGCRGDWMRQRRGCLGVLTAKFRAGARPDRPVRPGDAGRPLAGRSDERPRSVPDAARARGGASRAWAARGPPAYPELGSRIGTLSVHA